MTAGYNALTTGDERLELRPVADAFKSIHHDPLCTRKHAFIRFGFWQEDITGDKIPYWHVLSPGPSFHSSLSMRGLKEWGVI